jgi:hypothetical protein
MRPLILALIPCVLQVQDDLPTRLSRIVQQLGSEDFKEREAASEQLYSLPVEARPLVEAELKKGDLELEVRSRLERSLPVFKIKAKRAAVVKKKETDAAWNRKTTIEAYKQAGRADPKWDEAAIQAITLVVEIWTKASTPGSDRKAYELAGAAIHAGCDDPFVLYARARMYDVVIRKSFAESVRLHVEAARAMKERGARYHPMRRSICFARAADFIARSKKDLTDEDKKAVEEWLELAVPLLGKASADPETPETNLVEIGELIIATWMKLTKDRKVGFDRVFEALTQGRPDSTLPLALKGVTYTHYAWDARGGGWANTVTEDGWKKMAERLFVAEQALTEAWQKNPADPRAPTQMIAVELGQGKGREVMETWWKRAMEADPDNFEACSKKMYYLEPKWHGSPEDMLRFGRELLAGGNWEARLPFKLVDAHLTLSGYQEPKEAQAEYFTDEHVWKDFQAVYDRYLARYPDSVWDRSFYAKLACKCGRWSAAKAQFDKLGGQVMVGAFADQAELNRFRAEAAEKGK